MLYSIRVRYEDGDFIEGYVRTPKLFNQYERDKVRREISRAYEKLGAAIPMHYIHLHKAGIGQDKYDGPVEIMFNEKPQKIYK